MLTSINLDVFKATARAVPSRTATDVFFYLAEELGEVSVNLNRPHKADEVTSGELADVLICTLDTGYRGLNTVFALPTSQELKSRGDTSSSKELYMKVMYNMGLVSKELCDPSDDNGFELEYRLRCMLTFTMLIYINEYGLDYTELQYQIDKKCAKWARVSIKGY